MVHSLICPRRRGQLLLPLSPELEPLGRECPQPEPPQGCKGPVRMGEGAGVPQLTRQLAYLGAEEQPPLSPGMPVASLPGSGCVLLDLYLKTSSSG